MARLQPIHPDGIPKHRFLQPRGLSATALRVSPGRIAEIVRGRRDITPATPFRPARYLGTDAQSRMNFQTRYELQVAARTAASALRARRAHEAA